MSYRVTIEAGFEAAHHLLHYRGQPEPLHGHSYRIEATLSADALDADDLAVDFVEARRALDAIAKGMDYRFLNDLPVFANRNTSAENIARHVAEELARAIPKSRVDEVVVWEGPVNRASYRPPTT